MRSTSDKKIIVANWKASLSPMEAKKWLATFKDNYRPVLYGGGMHAGNVAAFMSLPNLSGVMIAAATLDPHQFLDLLDNTGRAGVSHV